MCAVMIGSVTESKVIEADNGKTYRNMAIEYIRLAMPDDVELPPYGTLVRCEFTPARRKDKDGKVTGFYHWCQSWERLQVS